MKQVVNCYYVHSSNMTELNKVIDNYDDASLLSWSISYMYYHGLKWEVCKYNKENHTFSMIACPTFDVRYEPVVGDSWIFTERSCAPKWRKGSTTVYHQKHLFVDEVNYDGFDIAESRKRTELLESIPWYKENKSRIGSLKIWEEFLKSQCLEKYMP